MIPTLFHRQMTRSLPAARPEIFNRQSLRKTLQLTADVHFQVRPWISLVRAVWHGFHQVPSYDFSVIMRGYGSPPPVINTESVILQNAPHSQSLLAMRRMAFLWVGWTGQNKFAKTYEFKNEREKHSLCDDCLGLCFFTY